MLYGVVFYGMAGCDMVLCGMVWYGQWYGAVCPGVVWCVVVWYGMVGCGLLWCDMVWYGVGW